MLYEKKLNRVKVTTRHKRSLCCTHSLVSHLHLNMTTNLTTTRTNAIVAYLPIAGISAKRVVITTQARFICVVKKWVIPLAN